ncbi:hypothetical protein JCM10207_001000 [Rhodosporidiobolus poonsookiae]
MASTGLLVQPPALRLSEEAMDLVCSFVREEGGREVNKNLRSLALTSRRWTSSAIRALWHDPTRSFACRYPIKDCVNKVLRAVVRHPAYGTHVKALNGVESLAYDLDYPERESCPRTEFFLLTMFRFCLNLESLSLPLDNIDIAWEIEIPRLLHLRHITLAPALRDHGIYEFACSFISSRNLTTITSLALTGYRQADMIDRLPSLFPSLNSLTLNGVSSHYLNHAKAMPPFALELRHLSIKPYGNFSRDLSSLLVPSLVSLILEACAYHTRPFPDVNVTSKLVEDDHWLFPFDPFPHLPHLKCLVLEYLALDLSVLELIKEQCPALEYLDFRDSAWDPTHWEEGNTSSDLVATFLSSTVLSLGSLKQLNLGFLPIYADETLPFLEQQCDERRIHLSYRPSLTSSEAPAPAGSPHHPGSPYWVRTPDFSPTTPQFSPTSPQYSPTTPAFVTPRSPRYSPTSPQFSPRSPRYSPTSPQFSPTSPRFSPTSPAFSPISLRATPLPSPTPLHLPVSPFFFPPASPRFSPTSPRYSPTSPVFSPASPPPFALDDELTFEGLDLPATSDAEAVDEALACYDETDGAGPSGASQGNDVGGGVSPGWTVEEVGDAEESAHGGGDVER